jgi:hypothetical protein
MVRFGRDQTGSSSSSTAPRGAGADEELLLVMGDIIFPGLVQRQEDGNGLRLWVEGTARDGSSRKTAAVKFQTLLGVLRAWRYSARQLREEQLSGLGEGAARSTDGTQSLGIGPATEYRIDHGEDRNYAERAAAAIDASQNLRNALWLNGRTNRTAADFYMIHEYAMHDFDGKKGITEALGISRNRQETTCEVIGCAKGV